MNTPTPRVDEMLSNLPQQEPNEDLMDYLTRLNQRGRELFQTLERELAAAREELTQAYAKLDCILKLTIHDDTFWAIEEIARISGGE